MLLTVISTAAVALYSAINCIRVGFLSLFLVTFSLANFFLVGPLLKIEKK